MMRFSVLLAVTSLLTLSAAGQNAQPTIIPSLATLRTTGENKWIDLDNDGDLDIISNYRHPYEQSASYVTLFKNNGNLTFTPLVDPFASLIPNVVEPGDYEGDGDVDFLVVSGTTVAFAINDGSMSFSLINGPLILTANDSVWLRWFDADGDGDLDVVSPGAQYATISLKTEEGYTNSLHTFPTGRIYPADLNNDTRIDFLSVPAYATEASIYLNAGDALFRMKSAGLTVFWSEPGIEFFDADGDGDADVLIQGAQGEVRVYQNLFAQTGEVSLVPQLKINTVHDYSVNPAVTVSDITLDGRPDIIVNGYFQNVGVGTFLYSNQSTTDSIKFVATNLNINTSKRLLQLLDLDGDKDPDLFFAGQNNSGQTEAGFHASQAQADDLPPDAPRFLYTTYTNHGVALRWSPPATASHLRYKVLLVRDGNTYVSPLSLADGTNLTPFDELLSYDSSITYVGLPEGEYHWKVQAVGATGQGSAFAEGDTFSIGSSVTGLVATANHLEVHLQWNDSEPPASGFNIFRRSKYQELTKVGSVGAGVLAFVDVIRHDEDFEYVVQPDFSGEPGQFATSAVVSGPQQFMRTSQPDLDDVLVTNGIVTDLDTDGDFDIVYKGRNNFNNGLFFLENDGTGAFQAASLLPIENDSFGQGSPLFYARDLDHDGDIDLIGPAPEFGGTRIVVYRNTSGVFEKVWESSAFYGVSSFAVEDMNADGRLDFLFANYTSNDPGELYHLYFQESIEDFQRVQYPFVADGNRGVPHATIGDFDQDGLNDIYIGPYDFYYEEDHPGRIFRNLGGGSFEKIIVPLNEPGSPLDADLDGKIDFVSYQGTSFVLTPGNGDMTFDRPRSISIGGNDSGSQPWSIRFGDLNLDGIPDLAGTGYIFNTSHGLGAGQYVQGSTFNFGVDAMMADFDNDGDLDFFTFTINWPYGSNSLLVNQTVTDGHPNTNEPPSAPSDVTITHVNGNVTLAWQASTDDLSPAAAISYNVEVKDGDGNVIINPETNEEGTHRWITGPGNSGIGLKHLVTGLSAGSYTVRVQALDASFQLSAFSAPVTFEILPGPENLEIERILLNKVKLTWNNASGESKYIIERSSLTSGFEKVGEVPADVTLFIDDQLEFEDLYSYRVHAIVGGEPTATSATVTWNTSYFVRKVTTLPNVGPSLSVGDLTNDGKMDLVITGVKPHDGHNVVRVNSTFENTGGGWIETENIFSSTLITNRTSLKEFNGDSRLDILRYCFSSATLESKAEILLNEGNEAFVLATNAFTQNSMTISALGDFDNDNDEDAVAIGYSSQQPSHVRNDGDGNYVLSPLPNLNCESCQISSVIPGDFDGDGVGDYLIFQNSPDQGYYLYLTQTNGSVNMGLMISSFKRSSRVTDINGDGLQDLVLLGLGIQSYETEHYVYINKRVNGSIKFEKSMTLEGGSDSQFGWGDFDHDGDLDLFTTSRKVILYVNQGNGAYRRIVVQGTPLHMYGNLDWIDFDDDGDLDLIAGSVYSLEGAQPEFGQVLENQMIVNGLGMTNEPPAAPDQLALEALPDKLLLTWNSPDDDHALSGSLSYDVVLYKDGVATSMGRLNTADGNRLILADGYVRGNKQVLKLPYGNYQAKVQAIDGSFSGSALSQAFEFEVKPLPPAAYDTLVYSCGRPVNITAAGTSVEWFSDESLTDKIATGNVYHPEESDTVYVTQTIDGTRSHHVKVGITIIDKPSLPELLSPNPVVFCESLAAIELEASGSGLRWYSDEALTQQVAIGSPVLLPTDLQSVYVAQRLQDCTGEALAYQFSPVVIDTELSFAEGVISVAELDGDIYRWILDGDTIDGETGPTLTAGDGGVYRIYIEKGECSEVSDGQVSLEVLMPENGVVKLFPNPSTGQFGLSYPKGKFHSVSINDVVGRAILTGIIQHDSEGQTINTSGWQPGIYFVSLRGETGLVTAKIAVH